MTRKCARKAALKVRRSILALATVGPVLYWNNTAPAATFTWDNNGATAPNPNDGAGAWNTTSLNFWNGASNSWNNANNNVAAFGAGGAGGIVTLAAPITLNGLSFNNSGYTITGNATNRLNFAGASPTVALNSTATTATMSATYTYATPLTVSVAPGGGRTLTLAGTNSTNGTITYTGGGTVSIASQAAAGTGQMILNGITIATAGQFSNAINVANSTTNTLLLTNTGTFTGQLSGGGVLQLPSIGGSRAYAFNSGNNGGFTGTMQILNNSFVRLLDFGAGSAAGAFEIVNNGSLATRVGNSAFGTVSLGALSGGATAGAGLFGSIALGSPNTTIWEVGALNLDTSFDAPIQNGNAGARLTGISKVGSNYWRLGGVSTYTADTFVNAGTLQIKTGGSINTTSKIFVNGNFDVTPVGGYTLQGNQVLAGNGGTIHGDVNLNSATAKISPGTAFAIPNTGNGQGSFGTINFANALNLNAGSINFDLSANLASGNDKVIANTLDIPAPATIYAATLSGVSLGTYTLINYTNLGPTGAAGLANLSLVPGGLFTAHLDTATPGQINLVVDTLLPARNLSWNTTAASPAPWDANASLNFFNPATAAASVYLQGDNVLFDDTPGVTTGVSISSPVFPLSLVVNTSTNAFNFSGTAPIGGTVALIKQGTSQLTIGNPNTYTGGTTIDAGTLLVSNPTGAGTGSVTLNGGAFIIQGAGAINNEVRALNSASTFGTTASNGSFTGHLNLSSVTSINFVIPGTSTFTPSSATFTGASAVTGSTINFGTSSGFFRWVETSPSAGSITFDLGNSGMSMITRDGNLNIRLGGLAGGPTTFLRGAGTGNNAGTYTIGGLDVATEFSGSVTNGLAAGSPAISIIKTAGGTLTLSGTNTYTGTTAINSGGTLIVNGTHSGGAAYTVDGMLGGSGVISAPVTVNAGGRLRPGNSIGVLTVGALSLTSTNLDFEVGGGTADKISVSGGLTAAGSNVFTLTDTGVTFGRYALIDYIGTPLADLSAFNTITNVGALAASLQNNQANTSIDLVIPNPGATSASWAAAVTGNWADNAKWSPTLAPNGNDHIATFGVAGPLTAVTLSTAETVAFVNFNAGSYRLDPPGPLTLDASGGYVGVNVNGGNHEIAAPVVLGKDGVFAVNSGASLIVSGVVSSASQSLTKAGGGLMSLTVANTYSGATIISGGTLAVGDNAVLGDSTPTNNLIFAGGALQVTAPVLNLNTRNIQVLGTGIIDTNGNDVQIDSPISGGGGLQKNGLGVATFNADNTYSGGLTVNAGTAAVSTAANLGDASGTLVLNGGALRLQGTFTTNRRMNLLSGGVIDTNLNDGTIGGIVNGTGALVKNGEGRLSLTGNNTFTAPLTVNGGTVGFGANSMGDANNSLILNNAAFQALAAINSPATRSVIINGTTGTFGTNGLNATIAGQISGPAMLYKTEPGVLTISGSNTYAGGTTVADGQIVAARLPGGPLALLGGTGVQLSTKGSPLTMASLATELTIIGGQIDLTNNALVYNYTTAGTQLTDVRNFILGGQIVSTTAFESSGEFAVGYAEPTAINRVGNYAGVPIDATTVIVAYTYNGDSNLDGKVNALDFNQIARNFGAVSGQNWSDGDFNYDGQVETGDFNVVSLNFNKVLAALPAPQLGALVPEPAGMLFAVSALGLIARRRRPSR